MDEKKTTARPEGWIFRLVVALAGLYLLAGFVSSLPILVDMFERARVKQEAREGPKTP